MKVLLSISYYTPYVSGLTLYAKRLAEELVKKGEEATIICNQHEDSLREEETLNGVRVLRATPILKISKGFFSVDFVKKAFLEVSKNDLVLVNLPQFEGIVVSIFSKLFNKKLIAIYHCEVVMPTSIINFFVELVLNISNFITLTMADEIVTYTKDFADNSKILKFFKQKINYVYPPIIEPNINKRVQKSIMEKIGKKPDYAIGIAARLASEKGIEYLLEAIPRLRQGFGGQAKFRIIIAGPMTPVGEDKYKEKILKLVEKYREYVVFLGEIKESDMGSFYSLIDVLVLPSINSTEAFGMVQVEAMMTGVPVVASDLPGVRVPVQRTGMGIVVPPRDSQKLADAIIKILFNKNKYTKDSKIIYSEFSIDKTIEFYKELMGDLKDE